MQKKRQAGLGGGLAGMSSGGGGTFFDKNKGNTIEGKLEKYTKVGGALFFVLSFVLGLLA
jgi:preprotein translocase subunit SecG